MKIAALARKDLCANAKPIGSRLGTVDIPYIIEAAVTGALLKLFLYTLK